MDANWLNSIDLKAVFSPQPHTSRLYICDLFLHCVLFHWFIWASLYQHYAVLIPLYFLWIFISVFIISPSVRFSSVQSFSHVWLFVTPWTAARQASLSITNSWSPPKLMSIESVMPSNHLILCPLLLLPSIPPSIRVFPVSQLFSSGGQVLEFQLQHQSFQWTPTTDLL